jgi:hypothetical protein
MAVSLYIWMLFCISAFESALEGVERMLLVRVAARTALPAPALVPGEMSGFVKPAELPITNQPSPATTWETRSQLLFH